MRPTTLESVHEKLSIELKTSRGKMKPWIFLFYCSDEEVTMPIRERERERGREPADN